MKITVVAAVSVALLGVFPVQFAAAKGSDAPAAKPQVSNIKQDVKAKKPVLPSKTAKKKPAVKTKPALAKASAKDAKPKEASSVKPRPANVAVKPSTGNATTSAPAKPAPLEKEVAKNDIAGGLPPSVQANSQKSEQNETTPVVSATVAMAPCQKETKAITGNGCDAQSLDAPVERADASAPPTPVKHPNNPNLVTFVGKPSVAPPQQSGGSTRAGQTFGSAQ